MPDGFIGVLIGIFIAPLVWFIILAIIFGLAELIKEKKKKKGPFV